MEADRIIHSIHSVPPVLRESPGAKFSEIFRSNPPQSPWTETWDALFWTFVADHEALFLRNPRSSMMAKTSRRFPPDKQIHLRETARVFPERM